MKLNKKKWFNKNILEFTGTCKIHSSFDCDNYPLMIYDKYGQLGGYVDYSFDKDDPPVVKATSRKLYKMKIYKAYFYLRHLSFKYRDNPEVILDDTRIEESL